MSFVHLDVRSAFSLKDGAFLPEELARRAAELGMRAVALTDRDGLYGAARFVTACEAVGVRPILGATLTLPRGEEVVLLARDDRGYANLCALVSDAHLLGERRAPSVEVVQVLARAAGLTCLLGPASPPGRLAIAGRHDAARAALGPFREAFGAHAVVAVRDHLAPGSTAALRAMLRLADETDTPALATNGVRYLVPGDAFLADVLACMRDLAPLSERNAGRRNAEGFLKPSAAMRALFRERPDLCDRTLAVAEACTFDLGLGRLRFPRFPTPPGRSAGDLLAARVRGGMADRGVRDTAAVRARLDLELATIDRLGYAAYFLTVADIVDDIRAMGIMCACRGSAAGSLVCYLTRISDVDPVRHDLSFERFLNPLREEPPDIDIDVESARREDVYDMVLSRHGEDRAACVAMVETFRARSAIREVGKALGLPEAELGVVARSFPHVRASGIREAIERLPELAGSNLGAGQLETLFRACERLDGFPRHLALHPCGIVLSDEDLLARVPLERSFRGHRMVQADKDDVERLGYLKLDVLGVRMLSAIRHCLDEVARVEGAKIDLDAIPDDDPATFAAIRASDTIGCFQIESPGQRELLQKLQPERFEDLIVEISLFRPGPMKSDMIRPYLARRQGRAAPVYPHPDLRAALRETFGVIVYHEQVIRVIAVMGGYDLAEADRIRRNLHRDDLLPGMRAEFLARTWAAIEQFASFGFCKAHAAAFAVPTWRSAWLKTHHAAAFLAGVLTHEPGMYPRRFVLEDARRRGIAILPLDVNASEDAYTVEPVGDGLGIRLGLRDVHGIAATEIDAILVARAARPFRGVDDLLERAAVSRPIAEALAHAGAFDAVGTGTRRDALFAAMVADPVRPGEQLGFALAPDVPAGLPGYSDAERVRAELDVLGVDASRHLVSFFEPLLTELGVTRARDLRRRRGGERLLVAGVKVASQTPAIRSGQRIIFLTLDDATGPIEVTVFESVQPRIARTVFGSAMLAVRGTLRRTGVAGTSIVAEDAWDLTALQRARRDGRLAEALRAPSAPPAAARRTFWHASPGSAGA
ncbi:MAG: DNA polymerase III subunit alpha [Actinomycetota bacterium]